jgi:hypothetical protein
MDGKHFFIFINDQTPSLCYYCHAKEDKR